MATTKVRGGQIKRKSIEGTQVAADAVNTDKINWGTGSSQVNAGDIQFPSANSYLGDAATVMDALEEIVLLTGVVTGETPSGNVDDSNVVYTLANTPISGSEEVYLNGLLMREGDVSSGGDYQISGLTITMNEAPQMNDKIRVSYLK